MIYEIIKNMENENSCILATSNIGESLFIPFDEANADYQQYLASLEETI